MALINGTDVDNDIVGTALDDKILAGAGNDTVDGGDGNDEIEGETGNDDVSGGGGSDLLRGGDGNDVVRGGIGDDQILISAGTDQLDGGDGTDILNLGGLKLTGEVFGAAVDLRKTTQQQIGTDSNEAPVLVTISSFERVIGSASSDAVLGTDGANRIVDILDGNDTFSGLGGDDEIEVRRGIFGASKSASSLSDLSGGDGSDRISFYGRSGLQDKIFADGDAGADTLRVESAGEVVLNGGDGDDSILLKSSGGTGSIGGGTGKDYISLAVQSGVFTVKLGSGTDTVAIDELGTAAIVVEDFVAGVDGDVLALYTLLRSGKLTDYDAPGFLDKFDRNNPFSSGHMRLLQDGNDTRVQVDRNGGADAFTDLVVLRNVTARDLTFANLDGYASGIRRNAIHGTDGDNSLFGTGEADIIYGLDGDDTLHSLSTAGDNTNGVVLSGPDRLLGGEGDDTYLVDSLFDRVIERAGQGIDTIKYFGSYRLSANVENLVLSGNSNFNGTGNGLANRIDGSDGNNTLKGLGGDDRLGGERGADILLGGAGADLLDGDQDNDRLLGDDGDDQLFGGDGKDTLIGGAGDDLIFGEAMEDLLTGGTGADVFSFLASHSTNRRTSADRISDFSHAENDRIELWGIDANLALEGHQSFHFIGSAAFSAAGQVRTRTSGDNTYIELEYTGDRRVDMIIRVDGLPTMVADDFIL